MFVFLFCKRTKKAQFFCKTFSVLNFIYKSIELKLGNILIQKLAFKLHLRSYIIPNIQQSGVKGSNPATRVATTCLFVNLLR